MGLIYGTDLIDFTTKSTILFMKTEDLYDENVFGKVRGGIVVTDRD